MQAATAGAPATATRPVVEQNRTGGCLSYFLFDPDTKDAAVIDPRADGVDGILARLKEGGMRLRAAMDTHAHADHVSGVARLAAETGAEAIVTTEVDYKARQVRDGDEIRVGAFVLRVIATPGHTSDSVSYQVGDVVFTGDALLIGGAGRTDFQNGSPDTLFDTFEQKLRKLAPATVIYPGHDYKCRTHSTIGDELRANPLFSQTNRVALVTRLMGSKNPPPANMGLVLAANKTGASANTAAIEATALKSRIDAGEALNLIDVRSPAEFSGCSMKGARNIPLEQVGAAAPGISGSDPLVLICEAGARATIASGAFAGRPNVMVLTGGMGAWRKAGLPTEGSCGGVWALERQVRLVAGAFVLIGAILGLTVNPWFFAIPVFFGAGLTFAAITNTCAMGMLLSKMPWNRRAVQGASAAAPAAGSCAAEPKGGGCAA
jgi:glyoxylase-like metal-dependent hydrolase (beta-lactamase superfamily II)/rhodanese-related sulfurtransferase